MNILKRIISVLLGFKIAGFPLFKPALFFEPITMAALIGAGGALGSSAISTFGGRGGGGKGANIDIDWEPPAWAEGEYYKPTQDYLFDFGKDVLSGDIPDYYKPIGEMGGETFDKFLDNVLRDTQTSVEESAVARGVGRSGATTSAVSKSIADTSAQYRWQDVLRALEGRKGFLNLGTGLVENVRGADLAYQGQRNQFNLGVSGLALKKEMAEAGLAMDMGQQNQDFFSGLIGSGLEAAGTFAGMMMTGSENGGTTMPVALGSANPTSFIDKSGGMDAFIDKIGQNAYIH